MTTLVKSFPFYKNIKQKMITHNGDNYTNKFYNMIYLDDNNNKVVRSIAGVPSETSHTCRKSMMKDVNINVVSSTPRHGW